MKHDQRAFTIIELLIASTIFSVILLLVTTGIVQIGKTYYKGVLQSRTQETARNIMDEISRGIQFSGKTIIPTTPLGGNPLYSGAVSGSRYGFCINDVAYSYVMDSQLATAITLPEHRLYVLVSYSEPCSGFTVLAPGTAITRPNSRELLGVGMRLTQLSVTVNADGTYRVVVEVGSGDRDLFEPTGAALSNRCKQEEGKQFCALSRLETTVQKRLK